MDTAAGLAVMAAFLWYCSLWGRSIPWPVDEPEQENPKP